jgi:hypothetical protein
VSETLYVTPAQVLAAKLALELDEEAGEEPGEALTAIANAQVVVPQQSALSHGTSANETLSEVNARLQRIEQHLQIPSPEASGRVRSQPSTQPNPPTREEPPGFTETVGPDDMSVPYRESRELRERAEKHGLSPEDLEEAEMDLPQPGLLPYGTKPEPAKPLPPGVEPQLPYGVPTEQEKMEEALRELREQRERERAQKDPDIDGPGIGGPGIAGPGGFER